jgi:hypothetical protein
LPSSQSVALQPQKKSEACSLLLCSLVFLGIFGLLIVLCFEDRRSLRLAEVARLRVELAEYDAGVRHDEMLTALRQIASSQAVTPQPIGQMSQFPVFAAPTLELVTESAVTTTQAVGKPGSLGKLFGKGVWILLGVIVLAYVVGEVILFAGSEGAGEYPEIVGSTSQSGDTKMTPPSQSPIGDVADASKFIEIVCDAKKAGYTLKEVYALGAASQPNLSSDSWATTWNDC